jgi:hypothetical protein
MSHEASNRKIRVIHATSSIPPCGGNIKKTKENTEGTCKKAEEVVQSYKKWREKNHDGAVKRRREQNRKESQRWKQKTRHTKNLLVRWAERRDNNAFHHLELAQRKGHLCETSKKKKKRSGNQRFTLIR